MVPPKKKTARKAPAKKKAPAKVASTNRRHNSKIDVQAFEEFMTYGLAPVLIAYIILSHIFPGARLDAFGDYFGSLTTSLFPGYY